MKILITEQLYSDMGCSIIMVTTGTFNLAALVRVRVGTIFSMRLNRDTGLIRLDFTGHFGATCAKAMRSTYALVVLRQGHKRDLQVRDRDETSDISFSVRDETETKTCPTFLRDRDV